MSIGNEQEELDQLEKLTKRDEDLISRMDKTFGYFRGDKFKFEKNEGEWETITSNRAKSEGWKIINVLASSSRQISIKVKDEKERERNEISKTESLVNNQLYRADQLIDDDPYMPYLQSQMAFYATVRGWRAYRLLLQEDDNGLFLDVAVWDRRNLYFLPGNRGVIKVYYIRYADENAIKTEYEGWNGSVDENTGAGKIIDIWAMDKEKVREAVIIGSEFVKEPEDVSIGGVNLNYLPIRIRPCGTVPIIHDNNSDNIAHVGEDYLVNNRSLIDEESRALSYKKTRAGMDAKSPVIILWDSTKGDLPPEFDKDTYKKGSFIKLDVGKGQGVGQPLPMSAGVVIENYRMELERMLNTGGLDRIAFGEGGNVRTAFETDVLNHNTREHIWPFKLGMEQDFVWMATEIVKQFKLGDFSSVDGIKAEQVVDDKEFVCKLATDELRDRESHSLMAKQEIQSGISSKRDAIEIHHLHPDPDLAIKHIAEERAKELFGIGEMEALGAMIDDYQHSKGDELKRLMLELAYKKIGEIISVSTGGNGKKPPEGSPFQPDTRAITARTPQPIVPAQVRDVIRRNQIP